MHGSGVSDLKRIAAGVMGIMMLVVLFSAFYIAAEIDHDCTGDDCHICAFIQRCENTLSQIGAGVAERTCAAAPVVFLQLFVTVSARSFTRETLVSKKVCLNN